MSGACTTALDAGVIRGVLSAVDCRTRDFAELGYRSLAGSPSFQAALTILLVVYVAAIGYRLLFAPDGARLSDAPGIALKVGAVLTLVASWSTFQTLVFDLAAKAPADIAALVAAPLRTQGARLAADPVNGLQTAYDQLNAGAAAFGKVAPAAAKAFTSGEAAAGQALADAAGALFATTAGVISVATIAVGVLTALGPLFVALVLFRQTRGLFEGWVRGLLAAALAPMGSWILIVMMLGVIEPWLDALQRQREAGVLDDQAAMTVAAIVFVFSAAQAALVAGACVIAMGYRWSSRERRVAAQPAPGSLAGAAAATSETVVEPISRAQRLAVAVRQMEASSLRSEVRRETVSGSSFRSRDGSVSGGGPPTAVGDAYRRPGFRPRARSGGAA